MTRQPPQSASIRLARAAPERTSKRDVFGRTKSPPIRALAAYTRSLAVLTTARIPLVQALASSAEQCADRRFREKAVEVEKAVRKGQSLARSLERQGVFDPLYIQMVKVGEMTGMLGSTLSQLALYLEKSEALRRKVLLALAYPGLILLVASLAVVFLLTVIVPMFSDMFADFGSELPGPTQAVLGVSNFVTGNVLWLILAAGLVVIGIRYYLATPGGRRLADGFSLRLPIAGSLIRKTVLARFCRTLGTLLQNGIPLVEALKTVEEGVSNVIVRDQIKRMRKSIVRGGKMSQPLKKSAVFPPMVVQMITVGEETARMDEISLHLAEHYEEEVDRAVDTLTSLIEPILIVFLGIVLGGILVAMYLPMFELVGVVPE